MTKIKDNESMHTVCVIGGGPAGMMAALTASESGSRVLLFERNDRLGKKLRITGKGRCNVTNDCDINEFLTNVPTNFRFLYAALNRFSPGDTKRFFEESGVPLKTERGKRVFPVSDKAGDIAEALASRCRRAGVEVIRSRVSEILADAEGGVHAVVAGTETYACDAVIVCTGGLSYPLTGSDGDGYRFAKRLGHTVVDPRPSLVPIVAEKPLCRDLQGLSLRNVKLRILRRDNGKAVFEDFGEMMFTHFGLTGPLVLSASAHIPDLTPGTYIASIDLKSALDEKTLHARLVSDFAKYANRDFQNALDDLLPQKLIPVFVRKSGVDGRKKANSITREERQCLVSLLKDFRVELFGFRPVDEAIVTKGGVRVNEISPKTMMSKQIPGLFFAGEVLDVDAYTGGFNLQIAFSTGVLAGENAAFYRAESNI